MSATKINHSESQNSTFTGEKLDELKKTLIKCERSTSKRTYRAFWITTIEAATNIICKSTIIWGGMFFIKK